MCFILWTTFIVKWVNLKIKFCLYLKSYIDGSCFGNSNWYLVGLGTMIMSGSLSFLGFVAIELILIFLGTDLILQFTTHIYREKVSDIYVITHPTFFI